MPVQLPEAGPSAKAFAVSGHHFRFHAPHAHLNTAFGSDWFGLKAEAFARFFGTPKFLVGQTLIVAGGFRQ